MPIVRFGSWPLVLALAFGCAPRASADSVSQTAQILIIIPERPTPADQPTALQERQPPVPDAPSAQPPVAPSLTQHRSPLTHELVYTYTDFN